MVGQQPVIAPPAKVTVERQPNAKANDFLIFSVILMVICCIHGNYISVCLGVPALICSLVVSCVIHNIIDYWKVFMHNNN